jgi:hypothetical protein
VKRQSPIHHVAIAGLVAALLALPVLAKPPVLILPHPSLVRAQQLLRQAEKDGAIDSQPAAVLALQERINAAWSAYHLQVEEKADKPDDDEAILARYLAEETELDAELLRATLDARAHEARLDAERARLKLPPLERLAIPSPALPAGTRGSR